MPRRNRSRGRTQPRLSPFSAPPHGGALSPLSPGDLDAIVDHAFEMLGDIGMAETPDRFAALLADHGARFRDDGRLLLGRAMVEAALERAPSVVSVPGFDPDRGITVGRQGVHIGTGGAAIQTLDGATGAYRDSTLADLWSMMRVLDGCASIHYGLRPVVARDLAGDVELDLNTAFASAAATSKPVGVSFTGASSVDPVVDLFDAVLGGEGRFVRRPFAMAVVVHVVPPLRFAAEGCDIMARAIERGMIVQTCSAGQAGATSPPSLAGALAQGSAEILAAVVLADAIRPGHPCIHAFMPFVSDLRSGAMTGEGHYLGHSQTLELMRSEYVYPELGDRMSVDEWVAAGEPQLWDRAHRRVCDILAAGRPRHLPASVEAEIRSRFPIRLPTVA